jgi:hypothetical protein
MHKNNLLSGCLLQHRISLECHAPTDKYCVSSCLHRVQETLKNLQIIDNRSLEEREAAICLYSNGLPLSRVDNIRCTAFYSRRMQAKAIKLILLLASV